MDDREERLRKFEALFEREQPTDVKFFAANSGSRADLSELDPPSAKELEKMVNSVKLLSEGIDRD